MTAAAADQRSSTAAIVLCGGQSRRMGTAKALLPFGPETLLQRAVRLVDQLAEQIVVVAAPGQPLPALPAVVGIARDTWAEAGPLAGLASGVAALAGSPASRIMLLGCDQPLLTGPWLEALLDAAAERPLVWAASGADEYPLPLVMDRQLAGKVAEQVAAGRRRLLDLVALVRPEVGHRIELSRLLGEAVSREALRNVNTPEDYVAALRLAGFEPPAAGASDE